MPEKKKRSPYVPPPFVTPREEALAARASRPPATIEDMMDLLLAVNTTLHDLAARIAHLEDALLEPVADEEG